MGRSVSTDTSLSASVAVSNINNPVTGVFGTGKVRIFPTSSQFVVPEGITSVRARLWGGGMPGNVSNQGGHGGGFALKTITSLTPGQSISVTVAGPSGTSSFGSYVSASTYGIGGDINTAGGSGGHGGGGAGSVWGNGGNGASSAGNAPTTGGGAGGGGSFASGGSGLSGSAGTSNYGASTYSGAQAASSTFNSIDFIGTGGGGGGASNYYPTSGSNGGGGGWGQNGGASGAFPGGGGGGTGYTWTQPGQGAGGLVIVEW